MSTIAETLPASGSTQIRPATLDDVEAVFALLEQLGIGETPERLSFEEAFSDAVEASHDHILLVADIAGTVVGYALTTVARLLYTNGDSAQLQELVVDNAARDRGVGSRLVAAMEAECRARGVRQLTVASIRAAAFYERLDYRSTADYLKKQFDTD
jgi:N-acetylglutamate synthase-like GNAT family acetyltransferase